MYLSVIVDIPAKQINRPFCYRSVAEGPKVSVGCAVLAPFGQRPVVGYVIGVSDTPFDNMDPNKIKTVRTVLAPSAFNEKAAACALWMSENYAAPLSECIRLFLPPGRSAKLSKGADGNWTLREKETAPVDDRWVIPTDAMADFKPSKSASRQRTLVAALSGGPVRMAELNLDIPGASAVARTLEKKGIIKIESRRRIRGSADTLLSTTGNSRKRSIEELTQGQRDALAAIAQGQKRAVGDVIVVDGVTGSGKTEVYLAAIEHVLASGRGAVVLVPEISLTPQTVGRFRQRFGDQVAVLHSRLSDGERFDQWDMLSQGVARVVVGARSALFAPVHNPGIYIIDEEHENSYKQSSAPRYHAREVAAQLARLYGAPLVLGSATPSMEALAACEAHPVINLESAPQEPCWIRVEMPQRAGVGKLPRVSVVDMTKEFADGHRSMFSRELTEGIFSALEKEEKVVLMLNRRGFASFLLCRECGYVPKCEQCSTSLTYHERGHTLECHTCGTKYPYPEKCPSCGSPYLRQFGSGTQRVEDELISLTQRSVPVIRMDADTTSKKDGHAKCLEAFDAAPSAILLGTQMIAKGLDFPDVTLVGVINADTTLKLPDFRAGERTYDLLEQVAGRAGRGDKPGRVIIQTYWPEHPAIVAVRDHKRSTFVSSELELRQEALYPPYCRLVNIVARGEVEEEVKSSITAIATELRRAINPDDFIDLSNPVNLSFEDLFAEPESECEQEDSLLLKLTVLGPAECIISQAKGRFRYHVLIKAPVDFEVGQFIGPIVSGVRVPDGVSVTVDVDPHDLS